MEVRNVWNAMTDQQDTLGFFKIDWDTGIHAEEVADTASTYKHVK